jgi:hypothetical protein
MYNSLRLLFAFDKSRRHFAVDNILTFFCCGERRFYRGFLRKQAFSTWFFVVKLW